VTLQLMAAMRAAHAGCGSRRCSASVLYALTTAAAEGPNDAAVILQATLCERHGAIPLRAFPSGSDETDSDVQKNGLGLQLVSLAHDAAPEQVHHSGTVKPATRRLSKRV
jgi:hypothetical protein